jgi:hypothetical protein
MHMTHMIRPDYLQSYLCKFCDDLLSYRSWVMIYIWSIGKMSVNIVSNNRNRSGNARTQFPTSTRSSSKSYGKSLELRFLSAQFFERSSCEGEDLRGECIIAASIDNPAACVDSHMPRLHHFKSFTDYITLTLSLNTLPPPPLYRILCGHYYTCYTCKSLAQSFTQLEFITK